jgi:hypothetical protein
MKIIMQEQMKVCSKCGELKPVSDYDMCRGCPISYCKDCKKIQRVLHFVDELNTAEYKEFADWLRTVYQPNSAYNYYRLYLNVKKVRTDKQILDAVNNDTIDQFVRDYLAETGPVSRRRNLYLAACRRYAEYVESIK